MKMRLKMLVAMLALALACFAAFAQGTPAQNPPPAQREPSGPQAGRFQRFRRAGGGPGGGRGWGGQRGRAGAGRPTSGRQEFGREGALDNPAIRQRLGITAEQASKIGQQNLDFQKAEIRGRADLQVKRIELNELLAADSPDRAAVDAKLQELSAAQAALEKSAIDNRLALRDILTPAQRQQLQQLRMNGFQPSGSTTQAAPRGARAPRPSGQRGGPPPNQQGQPPANQ